VVSNPSVIDNDQILFILSAMWYWQTNNLSKLADDDDTESITLKINLKEEGEGMRENYVSKLKNIIK
jgi:predicted chitinase